MDLAALGLQLDSMILKAFFNLNDSRILSYDSVTPMTLPFARPASWDSPARFSLVGQRIIFRAYATQKLKQSHGRVRTACLPFPNEAREPCPVSPRRNRPTHCSTVITSAEKFLEGRRCQTFSRNTNTHRV